MRGKAAWATLVVLLAVCPASAQIQCLTSFPAPGSRLEAAPDRVILWMSEPVDLQLSRFEVLDPYGRRFDLAPRVSADGKRVEVPLRPLAEGNYLVHYRAASVLSGHVNVGLYRFAVRTEPAASAGPEATWVLRALGAFFTVAAVASGSWAAAALATATALAEWAQAAKAVVPAPWPVLIRNGWAGLLAAGIQPGWALLLGVATTAAWAIPARPPRSLLRLVAAVWLALTVPVFAAAGGPLSLLSSSHGAALVLMVGAYAVAGLLAAFSLPVLGVRVDEPRWTLLLLGLLLCAAWALRPARDVGSFAALWLALGATCTAAFFWGQARLRGKAA